MITPRGRLVKFLFVGLASAVPAGVEERILCAAE